jgi:hypothetical protein
MDKHRIAQFELLLCRGERRIGHHIQEADMQFPNVLPGCPFERQNQLTAVFQALKCWQIVMGDQGHRFFVLTRIK